MKLHDAQCRTFRGLTCDCGATPTTPTLREALDAHEYVGWRKCLCGWTAGDGVLPSMLWADHREAAVREALGEHLIEASSDAALEAEPATHEHRPEYPSACTGCEHLAADLVSRMPPGLRAEPAAPPAKRCPDCGSQVGHFDHCPREAHPDAPAAEAVGAKLSDAVQRASMAEMAEAMVWAIIDNTFADATEEQVRHAVSELTGKAEAIELLAAQSPSRWPDDEAAVEALIVALRQIDAQIVAQDPSTAVELATDAAEIGRRDYARAILAALHAHATSEEA